MKVQCVKVSELRKKEYENLEKWMNNDDNVYVGRRGRIFIHFKDEEGEKKKRYFGYEGSSYSRHRCIGKCTCG